MAQKLGGRMMSGNLSDTMQVLSSAMGLFGQAPTSPSPRFGDEGPDYYQAAYQQNAPFATAGPYQTQLSPDEEKQYRQWVKDNKVNTNPDEATTDYDMRGYWKNTVAQGRNETGKEPSGQVGYPDTYKTPYDTTFSGESKYAKPGTPFVWNGNTLVDVRTGQVIFQR